MGYRAKNFDLESINTLAEQLSKLEARVAVLRGGTAGAIDQNQLEALQKSLDTKYVPVTRKINDEALSRDLTLTASQIPYDPEAQDPTLTIKGKVDLLSALTSIDGSFDTYADLITQRPAGDYPGQGYVVRTDETHNGEQWLYVWGQNPGSPDFAWKAVTVFGVNLDNYYTKEQTYSKSEADAGEVRQSQELMRYADSQTAARDSVNRSWTSAQINASSAATLTEAAAALNNREAALRADIARDLRGYVPASRKVNGKPLASDITINAIDVPYKNNLSVRAALDQFENAVSIQGGVDDESQLPAGLPNNVGYVVRNGTHYPAGPDGPYPELYVMVRGQWAFICRLLIDYSFLFTREEAITMFGNQSEEFQGLLDALALRLANEIIRAATSEDTLNTKIEKETARAMLRESSLDAAVVSSGVAALQQANNYTDSRIQVFFNTLTNKVDKDFSVSLVYSIPDIIATEVANIIHYARIRLDGTIDAPGSVALPVASVSQAGVFLASDYAAFEELKEKVSSLENQGTYIGESFPTFADLTAYVVPSWITLNDFTYVISDESRPPVQGKYPTTKYVWANIAGVMQWRYEITVNYEPPAPFTMEHAGTIRGSELDGEVYPNSDGTGAVVGWDALKTLVANAQAAITSINNFITNNLVSRLDAHDTSISALTSRMTTAESKIAALETRVAALQTKVDTINVDIADKVDRKGDTMYGMLYIDATADVMD